MNRLSVCLLALAVAAGSGTAAAQNPIGPRYSVQHLQPTPDRYGRSDQSRYDYARVLRVDPVFDRYDGGHGGRYDDRYYDDRSGYNRVGDDRRCYQRSDVYAGDYRRDDYYGRGDYYARDDYYDRYDRYDDYDRGYGTDNGRTIATVIGGVLGAVVGSQVGGGSARYATSAIGTMIGGIAGREVYEYNQRVDRGTVTVCEPVPVRDYHGNDTYAVGGQPAVSAYDVTYEYAGRTYTTRTNYHPGDRIRVRVDVVPMN